jgi:XTP/dITP diphosphohydrolase
MKFVLATSNAGKLREMREIFAQVGFAEFITQSDAKVTGEVEENGETFYDNALLKARYACEKTGLPAIADDSGLCVDALGGEPGVRSKRYGGGGLSDGELCDLLLFNMRSMEQRRAKFVSTIVCVFPGGDIVSASGECAGEIARAKRGSGGFGYDPVFYIPEKDKTMAELDIAEKNGISHRGRALRQFKRELTKYLKNNESTGV